MVLMILTAILTAGSDLDKRLSRGSIGVGGRARRSRGPALHVHLIARMFVIRVRRGLARRLEIALGHAEHVARGKPVGGVDFGRRRA